MKKQLYQKQRREFLGNKAGAAHKKKEKRKATPKLFFNTLIARGKEPLQTLQEKKTIPRQQRPSHD